MSYQGILFSYRDTFKEIELASQYFGKYVAAESSGVLDEWLQKIRAFKQSATRGRRCSWQIPLDRPLRTVVSNGAYQPDSAGALNVRGVISTVWTIEHVGRHAALGRHDEVFRLVDDGSTLVKILKVADDDQESCVAAWHFDVGVAISPGFHFHTQISTRPDAADMAAETYFPKTLDVPRLPAVLFFPLDALDFLLGELFLDQWPKYAVSQHALLGFFDYQIGRLKGL